MTLDATWFARDGDQIDVRTCPATSSDGRPFAVLRFVRSSLTVPDFAIQSTEAAALREIAAAASAAASWLEAQPAATEGQHS